MVTLPTEPSVSGSSRAGIDTQQSLVVTQARRFEWLHGRPERASDPDVAEWVADMRYHLACNQMSKMAAHRGAPQRFLEGEYGTILRQCSRHCYKPLVWQ